MLVPQTVQLYCLSSEATQISWEIRVTLEDLSGYTITVLRSTSAAGPYDAVGPVLDASLDSSFTDYGINLLSKWREYFYRLRFTKTSDSTYRDYGNAPLAQIQNGGFPGAYIVEAPPDLEALEASRRFDLVLAEFIGREVLYFARRSSGQRCPNCWDELKQRSTRSDCVSCFSTGFTGGYLHPVITRLAKVPANLQSQLTPYFELQMRDVLHWASSFPRLVPGGVVVDTEGFRWTIVSISRGEKLGSLTRQTAQLREVSRDQPEYKIPVSATSWNTSSLKSVPHRQYINAMDLESYEGGLDSVGNPSPPNVIRGIRYDRD